MNKKPDLHEELNNGTYQTGYTPPPEKGSSGTVAILLVLVIFLGGLVSILGFWNIRLLAMYWDQPAASAPLNIYGQSGPGLLEPEDLATDSTPPPNLPENPTARLEFVENTAAEKALTAQEVTEKALKSTVSVTAYNHHNQVSGLGMGTVISQQGYILTGGHVLRDSQRIYVTVEDRTYRAALVGWDILTDLAVLYIEASDLTAAEFAGSDSLQDAQIIYAPHPQEAGVLAQGMISKARQPVSIGNFHLDLIHTSVGSAQGPVYNNRGQIVGYNSQISPYFNLYVKPDAGFAVPSSTMNTVVNDLICYYLMAGRPTLGIETEAVSKVYQQYWNISGGLQVTQVNYHAKRQGLQVGDILLAVDAQTVNEAGDLYKLLLSGQIGSTVKALVFREGETFTLTLKIFDVAA